MNVSTSKKELIDWISTLDNNKVLLELENFKKKSVFDFDLEFQKSIPLEAAKNRSIERIRKYWSK